jgi:predicted phosphodiesterase
MSVHGNVEAKLRGASRTRHRIVRVAVAAVLGAFSAGAAISCGSVGEQESSARLHEALATPVTISFQDGVAPTSAYAGTADTTLEQASPNANFGAKPSLYVDGDDGSGVDRSALVKWNLSGIPAGSLVESASITLRITDSTSNRYDVYGVLRPWVEGEATWQNAANGSAWATTGALATSDRGAALGTVTGSNGTVSVSLNGEGLSLVQSWIDGGTNAGVLLANSSNRDGLDLASREGSTNSYRPKLTITYLPPDTESGSSGASSGGDAASGSTSGTSNGSASNVDPAAVVAALSVTNLSTDANLKVGFIGDTDSGTSFKGVLNLVKNEGASALVVQGDMSYSSNPTAWWNALEAVLGTSFPVFISRGNHDDGSWSSYLPKAANHLGGAARVAGAHDASYKTTYRGLVIATIKKGDTGANITPFLQGDSHIWKICSWHQNQAALQVGDKGDEMGWNVYETCRQQGAIVMTGHEHSYERTKTLTNMASQTVDPTCATPSLLCVGPGRTFSSVVGLGGNSVRGQSRCLPSTYPYGCSGTWAFIYTTQQSATHGAQFITFNTDDPKHATGYFKTINGATVDTFTIHHD